VGQGARVTQEVRRESWPQVTPGEVTDPGRGVEAGYNFPGITYPTVPYILNFTHGSFTSLW
jgi:hypothetical protein